MNNTQHRLSVIGLGLGFGISWALGIFLMGVVAGLWGWGMGMVNLYSQVYVGYGPSFLGGLIGGVWGFVDFFIFGVVAAFVYNIFVKCCIRK